MYTLVNSDFVAQDCVLRLTAGQRARDFVSAPAACQTCGTRHTAPTTGLVLDQCVMCGGVLVTERYSTGEK